jgi:Ca-activated chloride channel family protein
VAWLAGIRFADPLWLLALALAPLLVWLRRKRSIAFWVIPYAGQWARVESARVARLPIRLVSAGLMLLVVALARPQQRVQKLGERSQGYDLMLAVDLSGSMLTEDYQRNGKPINRLEAIKPVLKAFADRRPDDRIGMVIFAGRAYTLSPLTTDHAWLSRQIDQLQIGRIEEGTAIGDGLALSLMRLERLERLGQTAGEPRVGEFVVLVTDGANNRGTLAPPEAARLAHLSGIPVYVLGIGKTGKVSVPIFDDEGHKKGYDKEDSDLDEASLQQIVETTGGRYFRADDVGSIQAAFAAIDATRKTQFQSQSFFVVTELFPTIATIAGLLIALAAILILAQFSAPASRPADVPSA